MKSLNYWPAEKAEDSEREIVLVAARTFRSQIFLPQRDVEHTLTTVFIKLTVFAAVVSIKKCDEFLDHKFQNKSEIWNKRTFVRASHFSEKQFMLYIHRDKPTPVLTVESLCATTPCKRPSPICDHLSKTPTKEFFRQNSIIRISRKRPPPRKQPWALLRLVL